MKPQIKQDIATEHFIHAQHDDDLMKKKDINMQEV